jgi:hypothetical protein
MKEEVKKDVDDKMDQPSPIVDIQNKLVYPRRRGQSKEKEALNM